MGVLAAPPVTGPAACAQPSRGQPADVRRSLGGSPGNGATQCEVRREGAWGSRGDRARSPSAACVFAPRTRRGQALLTGAPCFPVRCNGAAVVHSDEDRWGRKKVLSSAELRSRRGSRPRWSSRAAGTHAASSERPRAQASLALHFPSVLVPGSRLPRRQKHPEAVPRLLHAPTRGPD